MKSALFQCNMGTTGMVCSVLQTQSNFCCSGNSENRNSLRVEIKLIFSTSSDFQISEFHNTMQCNIRKASVLSTVIRKLGLGSMQNNKPNQYVLILSTWANAFKFLGDFCAKPILKVLQFGRD
ncbi:hypothetical protein XENTR_v10011681 [Xenopus tropicalis]|nr:hypothetical protein XENTR_v10011681 [Xenopus tropicalis]